MKKPGDEFVLQPLTSVFGMKIKHDVMLKKKLPHHGSLRAQQAQSGRDGGGGGGGGGEREKK